MIGDPIVSVLLTVYNGQAYLPEALNSIQAQTFPDFELVVVDDGSIDDTPNILNTYAVKDSRIALVRNEQKLKRPTALNRGLYVCQAPLVAIADADDIYMPMRLEKQLEYLNSHPEVGVLSSSYRLVNEAGGILRTHHLPTEDRQIQFQLLFKSPLCHAAAMYRKELILKYRGYDEHYWVAQDYDLWARLRLKTTFANLSEPLIHVRSHSDSLSRTRFREGDALASTIPQRLLSSYLSRELGSQETVGIVALYRGYKMSINQIPVGLRLSLECLREVALKETRTTVREFRKRLANGLLLQAIYQSEASKTVSLRLFMSALRIDPTKVLSPKTFKKAFRLLIT